mmetsp:Transcript_28015/g.53044  ORF Transcript_28015/g.53044 Transcript_28015/m.53044 type:complete len:209 (-) Transcript_28015:1191-1817(-)
MPCRMWAILLTKSMTSSWRHSVVSVKLRMSQKPKMDWILTPSPNRDMPEESDLLRFFAMISAPASPKPILMRPAILVMVCRMRVVSIPSFLEWMSFLATDLNSFWSGLSEISRTSSIMISMGRRTKLVTSAVKSMVMVPRRMMTQEVSRAAYRELSWTNSFWLNMALTVLSPSMLMVMFGTVRAVWIEISVSLSSRLDCVLLPLKGLV